MLTRFFNYARRHPAYLVCAAALFLVILLWRELAEDGVLTLDFYAYQLFVVHLRSDIVTPVMVALSDLATPLVLLVLLVMIQAFAPGRLPGLIALVNLVALVILNVGLKALVARPRPDGFRLIAESGYSFPSGHSMVAMGFFGLIIWMVWTKNNGSPLATTKRLDEITRALCIGFLALLILGIGISRIYLGVHYASDVIAGFCVSLSWLIIYTKMIVPALFKDLTHKA